MSNGRSLEIEDYTALLHHPPVPGDYVLAHSLVCEEQRGRRVLQEVVLDPVLEHKVLPHLRRQFTRVSWTPSAHHGQSPRQSRQNITLCFMACDLCRAVGLEWHGS